MGNERKARRKGEGGLYIRPTRVWNEAKQDYEVVDLVQATKEIRNEENPDKRIRITGTARTPDQAMKNLQRNIAKYYKKAALEELGLPTNTRKRSGQTVEEYFTQWYSELKPDYVSTQLRYKYWGHIKNHITPHIGKIYLSELTYQQLDNLIHKTLTNKKKTVGGQITDTPLLGSNGLLNVCKTINQALNGAVARGLIKVNPMKAVEKPAYKAPDENIPHMMNVTLGMFKSMRREGDMKSFNHFLIALLGLRRGERLGLTFSLINLNGPNPNLTIRDQLARVTGEGLHLKPTTKNGKKRTVGLIEPFTSLLKELKEHRKFQMRLADFKPDPEFADLVFLKDNGKPYDLNEDNDLWLDVEQKYNNSGTYIRGHALRHVAATYMADLGVDEEVAQTIFGHQSAAIHHYYRRVTAKKQKVQLKKVEDDLLVRLGLEDEPK